MVFIVVNAAPLAMDLHLVPKVRTIKTSEDEIKEII